MLPGFARCLQLLFCKARWQAGWRDMPAISSGTPLKAYLKCALSLGFHGANPDPNTGPFVWISTLSFSSVISPRLAAHWQPCLAPWEWGHHWSRYQGLRRHSQFSSRKPLAGLFPAGLPKLGGSLFIRGCRGAFCQWWVCFARNLSPNTARTVIAAVLPQLLQGFTGPVLSGKHMFC